MPARKTTALPPGMRRDPYAREMVDVSTTRRTKQGHISHEARGAIDAKTPVHVTKKLVHHAGDMRAKIATEKVIECLLAQRTRGLNGEGDARFRVVHYSIQSTHIHLICEAESEKDLSRGMHALSRRITHALNKLWNRKGKLWAERYHVVAVRTGRQMRRLLHYVFENYRKHNNSNVRNPHDEVDWEDPKKPDPCASLWYLRGWTVWGVDHRPPSEDADASSWPVSIPRSSLVESQGREQPLKLGTYTNGGIEMARAAYARNVIRA